MHAPPLSTDTSSDLASRGSLPHHKNNTENKEADNDITAIDTKPPSPAQIVPQESNAWDVIQKWHNVADARARRRPNFDTYYSTNDEIMSTSSLLTFSVTEAPSTGGYTVPSPQSHLSFSVPPSPSGSSLASVSVVYNQVQQYSYASGPFKDKVRGNYIIKLGEHLFVLSFC